MSETLMTPSPKMSPSEAAEFLAWLRECAAESMRREERRRWYDSTRAHDEAIAFWRRYAQSEEKRRELEGAQFAPIRGVVAP